MDSAASTRSSGQALGQRIVLAALAALIALAVAGPWITPYDPTETNPTAALLHPGAVHLFGTDALGRDMFSRTLAATRTDLLIASVSVVAALTVGSVLGAAAGWRGGWVDRIIGRLMDTIMAFPLFVLAVGIAAAMGNSVASVVVATVVVNLPFYARQVRAEVSRRRNAGYVEAARLAGFGPIAILAGQILPNLAPPLMVQSSLNMGWAILNAAGLSFIGLGIRPPTPEWGIIVSEGAAYIFSGEWWLFVFPGGMLMLAVLIFGFAGDVLRDRLDPRRD
ncbi:MAG TPA: ABC transporter permease [Bradyrhizobium sp.]|nr:ABC transporter permease [Bradyrhizobium sp.]